jgi:hypothetical protein
MNLNDFQENNHLLSPNPFSAQGGKGKFGSITVMVRITGNREGLFLGKS